MLEPTADTAAPLREAMRSRAAARNFITADAAEPAASGDSFLHRYRLKYRCEQVPSHKRATAHVAITATVTGADGTVRYQNLIVSTAEGAPDAAMGDAMDTLLDDLARLR